MARYETDYEFDGRGHLARERIMKWDILKECMNVFQDKRTAYDLGENPLRHARSSGLETSVPPKV